MRKDELFICLLIYFRFQIVKDWHSCTSASLVLSA